MYFCLRWNTLLVFVFCIISICSLFPFHSSSWTELPLTKSGSFGQLRISRFPAELEKSDRSVHCICVSMYLCTGRSTAAKTDGQPTQIQGSETWSGVLHNSINSLRRRKFRVAVLFTETCKECFVEFENICLPGLHFVSCQKRRKNKIGLWRRF